MSAERLGGFFVAAIISLLAVVVTTIRKTHDAKAGWNLRPVVVAATDIPAGTELTFDVISQRSVPEQFMSPSYVTPEQASVIVGRKVTAPVLAGDPLQWYLFLGGERNDRIRDCTVDVLENLDSDGGAARSPQELAHAYFKEHAK
ncbi:MAG: SAF domain-containing protein [Myxococcaceae bacterium]